MKLMKDFVFLARDSFGSMQKFDRSKPASTEGWPFVFPLRNRLELS